MRELIVWQRSHGYALTINTEASIDLADDPELIDLMVEANVLQVFTGIESPRRESLAETRKHQNNRGDSLQAKIARMRDGGLVIHAGFIVGFDNDDERIFEEQYNFIQETGLAQAVAAVLSPIPTTPLYARLAAEGRLDFADGDVSFHPKQMTKDALRSGHQALLLRLFEPSAFFGRLLKGYRESAGFRKRRAALAASIGARTTWKARALRTLSAAGTAGRLARAAARAGLLRSLGTAYLRAYFRDNRTPGVESIPFPSFVLLCVLHWHYYNVVRHKRNTEFGVVSSVREQPRNLVQHIWGDQREGPSFTP